MPIGRWGNHVFEISARYGYASDAFEFKVVLVARCVEINLIQVVSTPLVLCFYCFYLGRLYYGSNGQS